MTYRLRFLNEYPSRHFATAAARAPLDSSANVRRPTRVRRRGRIGASVKAGFCTFAALWAGAMARADVRDPRAVVAKLDTDFQAAVKANDAPAMERILGENMILVLGNGTTNTRTELLQEARDKTYLYERQDEDPGTQTVRVWGDTAVVTARLWVKGQSHGTAFDRRLWFSDVYVRTAKGWHYVFGQASLHLPDQSLQ
jgi:ketosteroid isomerase-like protein